MCRPKSACFCRKVHFSAGRCIFLQERHASAGKPSFLQFTPGLRIMSGSLFLDEVWQRKMLRMFSNFLRILHALFPGKGRQQKFHANPCISLVKVQRGRREVERQKTSQQCPTRHDNVRQFSDTPRQFHWRWGMTPVFLEQFGRTAPRAQAIFNRIINHRLCRVP